MEIVKEITLDVARENSIVIRAKQFDKNSRFLKIQLCNDGHPISVAQGAVGDLSVRRADGDSAFVRGEVLPDGSIKVEITNWILLVAGTSKASMSVQTLIGDDESKLSTLNFVIFVEPANYDNTTTFPDDDPIDVQVLASKPYVATSIETHNTNEDAHENLISDLHEMDTQLGNQFAEAMNEHINNGAAHPVMKQQIDDISQLATAAYSIATGNTTRRYYDDFSEFATDLSQQWSQYLLGDMALIGSSDYPDFTCLGRVTKGDVNRLTHASVFSFEEFVSEGDNCLAGETWVLIENHDDLTDDDIDSDTVVGLTLRASKDVDYSIFATRKDVGELKEMLIKTVVGGATGADVYLKHNTEFNLGVRTNITFHLPDPVPDRFECIVNVRSGEAYLSIDSPANIIFTQDDCIDGVLMPETHRLYEINIKKIDDALIARVGACDYEVIE